MSMGNIADVHRPAKRGDKHIIAGEHRMMRRTGREVIDPGQIAAIIAACDTVEMAYVDAEGLTIVPLSFGFGYECDEAASRLTPWLHSTPRGRKPDAIHATAGDRLPVVFIVQTDYEVVTGRTTYDQGEIFKLIVGSDTASLVEDLDECRHDLQMLMAQQAHMPSVKLADVRVRNVTMWKVESDYFTTKIHTRSMPTHMYRHPAVPCAGVVGAR